MAEFCAYNIEITIHSRNPRLGKKSKVAYVVAIPMVVYSNYSCKKLNGACRQNGKLLLRPKLSNNITRLTIMIDA